MADENKSNDQLAAALARVLTLSEAAKASFTTMSTTMSQIMREAKEGLPRIESESQYEDYKRVLDEMLAAAGLSDRSNPGFDSAFARFASSNEGTVAAAYDSRINEWEQKRRASEAADGELTTSGALRRPSSRSRGPRPSTTPKLNLRYPPTPQFAAKHAEIAVASVKHVDNVVLDYSPRSLGVIDRIIQRLHGDGRTENGMAETIFCFGCYAGEVLVRAAHGRWREARDVVPENMLALSPFMVVQLPDGKVWSPIAKAFKQLATGSEESLEYFCDVATRAP